MDPVLVGQLTFIRSSVDLVNMSLNLDSFTFPSADLATAAVAAHKAWSMYCGYKDGSPAFTEAFSAFSKGASGLEVFAYVRMDAVQNRWMTSLETTIREVVSAMPVKDSYSDPKVLQDAALQACIIQNPKRAELLEAFNLVSDQISFVQDATATCQRGSSVIIIRACVSYPRRIPD